MPNYQGELFFFTVEFLLFSVVAWNFELLFWVGRGGCLKWSVVLKRGWAIVIKP